jgi:hypothetical protein
VGRHWVNRAGIARAAPVIVSVRPRSRRALQMTVCAVRCRYRFLLMTVAKFALIASARKNVARKSALESEYGRTSVTRSTSLRGPLVRAPTHLCLRQCAATALLTMERSVITKTHRAAIRIAVALRFWAALARCRLAAMVDIVVGRVRVRNVVPRMVGSTHAPMALRSTQSCSRRPNSVFVRRKSTKLAHLIASFASVTSCCVRGGTADSQCPKSSPLLEDDSVCPGVCDLIVPTNVFNSPSPSTTSSATVCAAAHAAWLLLVGALLLSI